MLSLLKKFLTRTTNRTTSKVAAPFLVHNLNVRRAAVIEAKLVTSVGWIGNQAHQAECSDHNPDSIGGVHAIDCMTLVMANQKAIVEWALSQTDDLEYVINQRVIWSRSRGFKPAKYTGTDPHTNHVHISGRHGSSHEDHGTCVGYSITAEQFTPEGIVLSTTDKAWIIAQLNTLRSEVKADTAVVQAATYGQANFTPGPDGKYTQSIRGKLDSIQAAVTPAKPAA